MAQPSRGKSGFKYVLLGASMLMGSISVAHAEDAAPKAKKADSDVVVVTGFKKSYADAVRAKKNNIEITDGISSDGLGRFPDLNVGEALQRIPGVQINREAEGRNATIGLRGMPGYYARTTLNGQAFAEPPVVTTTGGADGTPMGAFNSDIFTAFVIEKSPMANAQSGGLSGNIDMQIAPALGRKDGGNFKASYEHDTLGDLNSPAYTIGYNKHFSSNFAVFGTLAYKKENFRRDTLRYNSYSRLTLQNSGLTAAQFASKYGAYYGAGNTACNTSANAFCQSLYSALGTSAYNDASTGTKGQDGVYYLDFLRQYTRTNVGQLWTGSTGLEWKPNDNTKIGLIGYYSDRNMPNTMQYFLLNSAFVGGAGTTTPLTTVTLNSTPEIMADGRALAENVTYTNYDGKSSARLYSQHQQSKGLMANYDWHNEKWHVWGILTSSSALNYSVETELDMRTVPTAAGNGLSTTIDTGFGSLGGFSQVSTPNPQQAIYALPFYDATSTGYVAGKWNWKSSDPENLYTYDGSHVLNISGTESFATNTVNAAQIDAERTVEWGPITSIQGGIRLENNKYGRRGFRNMAYGAQTSNITQAMLVSPPSVGNFMEGKAAITGNWQVIDPYSFLKAITPVTSYNGSGLTGVGLNVYYKDGGYATGNYDIFNNLSEAYVQAKFETQVLGHRIRGNVGLRDESTSYEAKLLNMTTAITNGVGSTANFSWEAYKNKYSHLLPSGIAVVDLTDDMVLRGAFYKTYVRPLPQNSNPVQSIIASQDTANANITDLNVGFSNSRLKPYTADSYDLSWEWYNRPNGVIALAYFTKKLMNRVESISDPAILCPSDGGGWGYGTLTWDGTYCTAAQKDASGNTVRVFASGSYNVDKPTYVHGLEFNIQQNLDFLPGFWKNFGGDFNYAFMQAKQTGANAAASPFPGISKYTFNTIVYYETPKYGIRAVYNWRSAYPLTAAGTYTGAARIAAARGQLDLSASYNINDRVSVSLDAYNMTNSYRQEYETDPRMIRWIDYDGRTYTFTVKATF
ncbi:TonB-dependent receptor [Asticcacaulis solisilvae]|uniref:TonB-dependent receptor n=1 Tax=Asticcacaulis solisilvae TaxID=1217274 RepID=UPI003FD75E63